MTVLCTEFYKLFQGLEIADKTTSVTIKELGEYVPGHINTLGLNRIKEFLKTEGYVVMESNHRIPVARQRKSDFLGKL